MAQSRSKLQRVIPRVNDTFVDTRRQPVMTLIEDSSPGVHDMLFPPCDYWRYQEAGVHQHESCAANLRTELAAFTLTLQQDGEEVCPLVELERSIRTWGWTPEPLNLFMNVPVSAAIEGETGSLRVTRPCSKAGDYVILRAEIDCLIVMSACPNDLSDTNGGDPGDAAYEILS